MTFRLPDQAALDALVKRSHVRVVRGRYSATEAAPAAPAPQVEKPAAAPKPKAPKKKRESRIEIEMELVIKDSGLPAPERHFVYLEDRNYSGDFVWPNRKVAVEVDGGAHKTPGRFGASHERHYLLSVIGGWTIVHVGKTEVRDGRALEWLLNALVRAIPSDPDDRTAWDHTVFAVFKARAT